MNKREGVLVKSGTGVGKRMKSSAQVKSLLLKGHGYGRVKVGDVVEMMSECCDVSSLHKSVLIFPQGEARTIDDSEGRGGGVRNLRKCRTVTVKMYQKHKAC